jgi:hypothetical protein
MVCLVTLKHGMDDGPSWRLCDYEHHVCSCLNPSDAILVQIPFEAVVHWMQVSPGRQDPSSNGALSLKMRAGWGLGDVDLARPRVRHMR